MTTSVSRNKTDKKKTWWLWTKY